MKTFTVYEHISPSGKSYIGITSQKPKNRWRVDGSGYKTCPLMWNAICKYGWDNFQHIIHATGLTELEALDMEIALIAERKSDLREYGYNYSSGGDCTTFGYKHSPEHIEKCRQAKLGWTHTPETRVRMSEVQRGIKKSPQHIERIRQAHAFESKRVVCIETGNEYDSIAQAAKAFGGSHGNMSRHLIGYGQSFKGHHFEYVMRKEVAA